MSVELNLHVSLQDPKVLAIGFVGGVIAKSLWDQLSFPQRMCLGAVGALGLGAYSLRERKVTPVSSCEIQQNTANEQLINLALTKEKTDAVITENPTLAPTTVVPKQSDLKTKVAETPKIVKTEQQELTDRTAEIWDCISRRPNLNGDGFIYAFKVKAAFEPFSQYGKKTGKAFDALRAKNKEIYPAVEAPDFPYANCIIENLDERELLENGLASEQFRKEAAQLGVGYSYDGEGKDMIVYLPDREALLANWNELRKQDPQLPQLTIATEEGIASDRDYAQAYFNSHVLLCSGKEFYHDSIVHVVPTLIQIKALKQEFSAERERVVAMLSKLQKTIEVLEQEIQNNPGKHEDLEKERVVEKLGFLLGYLADVASSRSETGWGTAEGIEGFMRQHWDPTSTLPFGPNYFQNRFGSKTGMQYLLFQKNQGMHSC